MTMGQHLTRMSVLLQERAGVSAAAAKELAVDLLKAIREPTEAQVAAGIEQAAKCTDNWTAVASCVAEHLWTARVDAELEAARH
jgi:hypothetical protein